jgi:hypothetical protein
MSTYARFSEKGLDSGPNMVLDIAEILFAARSP